MLLLIKQVQQNSIQVPGVNIFQNMANFLPKFWQNFKFFSEKTENGGGSTIYSREYLKTAIWKFHQ